MRHLVHLLAFALTAAPPQFEVVNKCPPVFVVVNKCPPVAPEVAAVKAFRNGGYHAGHDCPTCGRQQFTIHSGAKNRVHYHRCPYDGTIWQH